MRLSRKHAAAGEQYREGAHVPDFSSHTAACNAAPKSRKCNLSVTWLP
jgi:hypothetical protein